MDVVAIISALTEATKVAMALYDKWQEGKVVLSETDAKAVHEALLKAQAATAALRPLVDDALEAAARR